MCVGVCVWDHRIILEENVGLPTLWEGGNVGLYNWVSGIVKMCNIFFFFFWFLAMKRYKERNGIECNVTEWQRNGNVT